MRPGNFPTIRLAQLAALICHSAHLFLIREMEGIKCAALIWYYCKWLLALSLPVWRSLCIPAEENRWFFYWQYYHQYCLPGIICVREISWWTTIQGQSFAMAGWNKQLQKTTASPVALAVWIQKTKCIWQPGIDRTEEWILYKEAVPECGVEMCC